MCHSILRSMFRVLVIYNFGSVPIRRNFMSLFWLIFQVFSSGTAPSVTTQPSNISLFYKQLFKFLNVQPQIRPCRGNFFLKIDKHAGQIPVHMQDGINVQGDSFLKNNKHADQNKAVQGEIFSQN